MTEKIYAVVWHAVGRATERAGGTHVSGFLGESYAIPDAAWDGFPARLTAELGAGWDARAGGEDDPYGIEVSGPQQAAARLTCTRVTTHSGVMRRLVLEAP